MGRLVTGVWKESFATRTVCPRIISSPSLRNFLGPVSLVLLTSKTSLRLAQVSPNSNKFEFGYLVPLVGIEPTSQLPQSCVLSIERQGLV